MTAAMLLGKLDGVHQVAAGRWRARCPSHDGTSRNVLSIGETVDGTVLIKCFHGCGALDVVRAVGLELHDLFPERPTDHRRRPDSRPFHAADALAAMAPEVLVVAIVAADMVGGHLPARDDHDRLQIAATRIRNAVDATGLDREGRRIHRQLMQARQAANDASIAEAVNV